MSNASDFVIENGVLKKYVGKGGNVVIPEGITNVGASAFESYFDDTLTSITIPEGVTRIGVAAFAGCGNLEKVSLPNTLKTVGDRAFSRCKKLADADGFVIVRGVLFNYYGNGGEVIIPEGVKRIEEQAFASCDNITSIIIPESVKKIGARAFERCSGLVSVSIPSGVTKIDYSVFKECKRLRSVTICGNVTQIDESAFGDISEHAKIIAPKTAFAVLKEAKLARAATLGYLYSRGQYNTELTVSEYQRYASTQKRILLPYVFSQDMQQGLACYADAGKITAKNIEEEFLQPAQEAEAVQCVAFLLDWKSKNISNVAIEEQLEREILKDPYNAEDMRKLWSYKNKEDGTLEITSYKGKEKAIVIPERIGRIPVTSIADEAFSTDKYGRASSQREILRKITSVTIPDSIVLIGDQAFYGCENLANQDGLVIVRNVVYSCHTRKQHLIIPEGVTEISKQAFYECSNLKSVTLPDSLLSIGQDAFSLCWGLTDNDGFIIVKDTLCSHIGNQSVVIVPDGVKVIAGGAFSKSSGLKSVMLFDGVTSIESYAFVGQKNLTDVHIPASVMHISKDAFVECRKFKIHTPAGSYAEQYAKENKIKVCIKQETSINTVAANTDTANDAFAYAISKNKTVKILAYCLDEPEVVIPGVIEGCRVAGFAKDVFKNNRQIVSVVWPSEVAVLPKEIFSGCSSLKEIVLPEGVTEISEKAFYNCESLTSISIPSSVTQIHDKAFECVKNTMRGWKYWNCVQTIKGASSGFAKNFAKKHKIPFVAE